MSESTITALVTAPAPGGVAIIRVSGSKAKDVISPMFEAKQSPLDHSRVLIFGKITNPTTKEVIDKALCVFMPNPDSYTGEDVVEFQIHGSLTLATKILEYLYELGIKPAEPGEFTKRAFLNGKIDLAQAEAVNDLINSNSERAAKIATEQLEGRFSESIEKLGEPLRDALAELEANLDFPEEDIEPDNLKAISKRLNKALSEVKQLLKTYDYGHVVKDGLRVLLAGRPNAGKSSILNLLLGIDRAIVTEVSGTTRDLIEEQAVIEGFPFIFCDSAGLTDTKDKVELIGIELAYAKLNWADLVLFVIDATDLDSLWLSTLTEIQSENRKIWLIVNKIDLEPKAIGRVYCDSSLCERNFYLSTNSGEGFDSLKAGLVEEVTNRLDNSADSSGVITNARHKSCLLKAQKSLTKAQEAIAQNLPTEIISAELQLALSSLEEIIGKTYNDDILDRIFSKFCIGK
ncbi:MAG: tRNA uridine-5-carboxymethylaminomethyl(34) synthesis GTPase MnmE [Bdellovibrionota bacterium]